MAQDVGDAVVMFLGDTTQLDLAYDRVAEGTEVAVEPANIAVKELAQNWEFAGSTAAIAGAEGLAAGEEMAEGAEKASFSMREAKGEIGLLGEATGVTLPRHVRAFVAELPGVGEALEAAFSATAIFFVIEAITHATEKLTEWINETFIFTEAMKAQLAEIGKSNVTLNDHLVKLKELKDAYDLIGTSSIEQLGVNIAKQQEAVKKAGEEYRLASDTLFFLNQQQKEGVDVAEKLTKAQGDLLVARSAGQLADQQLASLQKQFNEEALKVHNDFLNATIAASKTAADDRIKLTQSQGEVEIAQLKSNVLQKAQLQAEADEATFQEAKRDLQARIGLLAQDPTKNETKIIELNSQLEHLETEHQEKINTIIAGFLELRKKLVSAQIETTTEAVGTTIVDPMVTAMEKALAAEKTLGIEGSNILLQRLDQDRKAYQELASSGLASQKELQAGADKLTQAEDRYNASLGKTAKFWEVDSKKIGSLAQVLTGEHVKLGTVGKAAFDDLALGMGSAIAAYARGQATIGQALKGMLQDELATISQRSTVKAIEQLAAGFATLFTNPAESASHFESAALYGAIAAGSAVAGHALGSGNTQAGTTDTRPANFGPAGTSAQGGQQESVTITTVQNVPALGNGGLITGPTLAMLGERPGEQELVQPIDKATGLPRGMEAGGHQVHNHFHIKGDVVDHNGLMKRMSREVGKGKSKLFASNAKRSQGR